jgi:TolB-like protein
MIAADIVRIGDAEIDLDRREVRRGTFMARLQDQPLRILTLLLERAGEVILRQDIERQLWPDGTFVDFEHGVNAAIKRLRVALGDDAAQPRFVETVPRRGYRFIGRVERGARETAAPAAVPARPRVMVLPFTIAGGDASHAHLGLGLTEELIAQLIHRCGGRIAVASRAAARLPGDAPRQAPATREGAGVDYVVKGSVRIGAGRIRITVQLVDAHGETHRWAHGYDRAAADCPVQIQTDVAADIARGLDRHLTPVPAAIVTALGAGAPLGAGAAA